jgi:uncharacterized protein
MRTSNRQWPAPDEPWILGQKWRNLLFAHWPVPVDVLRPYIPRALSLDTFDGSAWIGVTPFVLDGLRFRPLPPVPGISRFAEINVRTYVTAGDKPGVFFFSLDAASRAAVLGARITYGLPYFFTHALVDSIADGINYRCTRDDRRGHPATFRAQYRPSERVFNAEPGTIEYFLTERYCLYAVRRRNRIWRAEIDHVDWPLQIAQAEIGTNTMAAAAGIDLPDQPTLLHFSRFIDVQVWRPKRVPDSELHR